MMILGTQATNIDATKKGFEIIKKFLMSRLKWLGSIALGSFLVESWLPAITLPATLLVWNHRDQIINKHYLDFKSGKMRNYAKCTKLELDAFLEGVGASISYFNQFKANFPRSCAWKNSKCYFAGLGAGVEGDEELIEMVRKKNALSIIF